MRAIFYTNEGLNFRSTITLEWTGKLTSRRYKDLIITMQSLLIPHYLMIKGKDL